MNFIQNLSKIPSKFFFNFATFIPESFLEISANFSENFLKNLVKIAIKFYLRIVQILVILYPKFLENDLFFLEFPQIFIKILSHQHFHNQLIKIFKNVLRNLRKF